MGGLAAAGLGLRNQIAALQDRRQALLLDRRHLSVAKAVEIGQHGPAPAAGWQRKVAHGKSPAGERRPVYTLAASRSGRGLRARLQAASRAVCRPTLCIDVADKCGNEQNTRFYRCCRRS